MKLSDQEGVRLERKSLLSKVSRCHQPESPGLLTDYLILQNTKYNL